MQDDEQPTTCVKNTQTFTFQLWEASSKTTEGGRKYWELTVQKTPNVNVHDDGAGGVSSYRIHSLAYTITVQQDDDQQPEGVISRVFRNKRPEISPNISYYSTIEYPQRDFALSCGIVASLYLPHFKTVDRSGRPDGVIELVTSCEQELMQFFDLNFSLQHSRMDISALGTDPLYVDPRIDIREPTIPGMDHFLTVVCQKFPFPLAQYWTIRDPNLGALRVMYQSSNRDFENITPWCKFKDACLRMHMNIGEGLVGKTYLSQKPYFCRDITELSITNYPLAHYAQTCGSIACFTISLDYFGPPCIECVLEFFLPSQKIDSYHPQTLLNSLLATMKEHLDDTCLVNRVGQFGQLLSIEVINFLTHDEPEFIEIGQPINFVCEDSEESNEQDEQSAEKDISTIESLSVHFGRSLDDAAKSFGVGQSTFKHICRDLGIEQWQYGKRRMDENISSKIWKRVLIDEEASRRKSSLDMQPVEDTLLVAHKSQNLHKITVKASYNSATIRFELHSSSGFAQLEDNVIERLHLERKSFSIKYRDDDDDWVVIACDKDVEECMEISRSLKKTTINMLIDSPIIQYALIAPSSSFSSL